MRVSIAPVLLFVLVLASPDLPGQVSAGDQQVVVSMLPCADGQQVRKRGFRQLAWEIQKRTSLEVALDAVDADPAGRELFATPFLIWSCQGPVAKLSPAAEQNLQRFLSLGGLLWIDDPLADENGAFRTSIAALMKRLWPDKPLQPLTRRHVLFKSFFLIEQQGGRRQVGPMQGLELGERLAVILTPNDLLGALSRDLLGNQELTVDGGSLMREHALRTAINLIMYSLCLDYKDDRVHLPFILKRRRLE